MVDEVERGPQEFFVHSLHPLAIERRCFRWLLADSAVIGIDRLVISITLPSIEFTVSRFIGDRGKLLCCQESFGR